MRRKSKRPLKTLTDRVDRAFQDWHRDNFQIQKCESCGVLAHLLHHFIEKSQSAGLRYELRNCVWLCKGCHFRHHMTGDQSVMNRVILKRGMKWVKWIEKERIARKGQQLDRPFLEKQIKNMV